MTFDLLVLRFIKQRHIQTNPQISKTFQNHLSSVSMPFFLQFSPSTILPSHFSDGNHPSIPIQGPINHGVNILTQRNICFPYIPISCFLFSNHVQSPTCTSSRSNLRVSSPNCSSPGRPFLSSRDQQIFWGNSWII